MEPIDVPAHVPAELVWDHDINTYAAELDDPYLGVARLCQGPELLWARKATRFGAAWLPTRFALVQEIFMDTEHFSNSGAFDASDLLGVDWRLNPLEIDPPEHMRYRQLLQPWFTPKAINKLEDSIRTIARTLIARFEAKGECEFIDDFLKFFPSMVFLGMMGLPLDKLDQFLDWEETHMRGRDIPTRVAAIRAIVAYLEEYVEARRSDPRDDLVTAILTAEIDGRPLTHGEVMGMALVLYLGGLDTVLSSVGWYMRYLTQDQSLQARLRANPDDIPAAVEDFLRAYGVTGTGRIVKEDFEFHGVLMKKGDRVACPTYLAGRDPREYANPDVVDPDRRARHLTLATGVHNCLGAHLARREIKVVLEEWLSRFSNIRVPDGQRAEWRTEGVWNVSRLPLVWN